MVAAFLWLCCNHSCSASMFSSAALMERGYRQLPRRGYVDEFCLTFFPVCYDWNSLRLPPTASHREVWLKDAAAGVDDEEELQADLDAAQDKQAVIDGGEGGVARYFNGRRGGIMGLADHLSHVASNAFRKVFGISIRRVLKRIRARIRGHTGCGDKRCWDCFEQDARDTYIFVYRCHKAFECDPTTASTWCGCARCGGRSSSEAVKQLFPSKD